LTIEEFLTLIKRTAHFTSTKLTYFVKQDLHPSIHRKRRLIIVHTNTMDNYGNDLLTSAFIHSILIILDENLPPKNTSSNIVKETVRFAKVKEINNEYNIANTFSYIKIVTEDQTIEANRRRLIKYHATR
jgi:hypothetical protein